MQVSWRDGGIMQAMTVALAISCIILASLHTPTHRPCGVSVNVHDLRPLERSILSRFCRLVDTRLLRTVHRQ